MSCVRHLVMIAVAGSALLLISAPAAPGPRTPAPAPPPPPAPPSPAEPGRSDPEAVAALDRALAGLDPKRLEWMEMDLWQKTSAGGVTWQAEGRYLAAPGRRWRLDLRTQAGATAGRLQVVSDGQTVWQGLWVGSGNWFRYSRVELPRVREVLDGPGTPPQVADEFYQEQAFGAVAVLLPGLRRRMDWVREEPVERDGRTVLRLAGTWTPAAAAALAPAGQPWPAGLPRRCRLYLDAETLWPHRLEWWGADPLRGDEALLVETEYRAPVLNRPLTAERCAAEFRPDADPRVVPDVTAEVVGRLRARAQQLAAAR